MIAISAHVHERIEKYYRRKVDRIIFPPVSGVSDQRLEARSNQKFHDSYFLVVARLVPYKRVDLAIRACIQAQKKLVIVGTGSDLQRLKDIANRNELITFAGFVAEEALGEFYQNARALLCPQEEDFGIVSVEAQSVGIPVISYAHSGVAETIIPKKTGLLFQSQSVDSLLQALTAWEAISWDRQEIRDSVTRFDQTHFITAFAKAVTDAVV